MARGTRCAVENEASKPAKIVAWRYLVEAYKKRENMTEEGRELESVDATACFTTHCLHISSPTHMLTAIVHAFPCAMGELAGWR